MEVCLRRGGHPAYDEIIDYPPKGVRFSETKIAKGIEGKITAPKKHRIKRRIFDIYRDYVTNVNAVPMSCKEDVIYSCGMMVRSRTPWVCDFEHTINILGGLRYRNSKSRINATMKHIEKSRCTLLPWSRAALKNAEHVFGEGFSKISDKFRVIYPAMHIDKSVSPRKNDTGKVRFLFISRHFWMKSGRETLMAFDRISKKCDAEMTFLSNTEDAVKNKFSSNSDIKFIRTPISREDVFDLYRKSDIFVLPTLSDTYGFVYPETMSFGLPVIATNVFAVPEIVENGKNGIIVEPELQMYDKNYDYKFRTVGDLVQKATKAVQRKLVDRLESAMLELAEDDKIRRKYGRHSRHLVEKGKFSIEHRNRELKAVVEELSYK